MSCCGGGGYGIGGGVPINFVNLIMDPCYNKMLRQSMRAVYGQYGVCCCAPRPPCGPPPPTPSCCPEPGCTPANCCPRPVLVNFKCPQYSFPMQQCESDGGCSAILSSGGRSPPPRPFCCPAPGNRRPPLNCCPRPVLVDIKCQKYTVPMQPCESDGGC